MRTKQLKSLPKSERKRLAKLVELEAQARIKGFKLLAGVDEVGRGPLAGPVVAAACSIPEGLFFAGINDSKQLSALQRELLCEQLTSHPEVHWAIGRVDHEEIDRINIYQATLVAMKEAIANLTVKPDYLLVDGLRLQVEGIDSERIIKGDTLSQMIAAASIIAKVDRDRIMRAYHLEFPEFGFDEHKGYSTEKHRLALAKYGPSPIHRKSFETIAAYIGVDRVNLKTPDPGNRLDRQNYE